MSAVSSKPKGWSETAVKDDEGNLTAVVTRPCEGAKWFLHRAGFYKAEKFTTKAQALAASQRTNPPAA